jgi:hypothetical protein
VYGFCFCFSYKSYKRSYFYFRLKDGKYEIWRNFETDVRLIWSNGTLFVVVVFVYESSYSKREGKKMTPAFLSFLAMLYNKPDTIFFKVAAKLQAQAEPLLVEAQKVIQEARVNPESGALTDPLPPSFFSKNQPSFVGSDSLRNSRGDRRASLEDKRKGKSKEVLPDLSSSSSSSLSLSSSNDLFRREHEEERNSQAKSGHPLLSYIDFGQKVKAKWTNGQYYAATVCLIHRESNTIQVVFDDGLVGVHFFFYF